VIVRIASAFILIAQLLLVAMLFDLSGRSAIAFTFVGAPLLGAAVLILGFTWWRQQGGKSL
jgi:hypothetical protein